MFGRLNYSELAGIKANVLALSTRLNPSCPSAMSRSLLTFVMIALIALQSLASVADTHGLHQIGGEHFEHAHAQFANASAQPNDFPADLECNHCCHCHGTVHFFLDPDITTHFSQPISTGQTDYRINYTSYQPTPDSPPPIT